MPMPGPSKSTSPAALRLSAPSPPCERHFRRDIDIVVNNAALAQEKPFETLTDADWDRMLAVNLRGAFIVAQETLPAMARRRNGAASSTSPPSAGSGAACARSIMPPPRRG